MAEPITRQYPVLGLTCISCSEAAASNLRSHTGVLNAEVHFSTNSAQITYDPDKVQFDDLQHKLRTLGYTLVASDTEVAQEAKLYRRKAFRQLVFAGAVGLPFWILEMLDVITPSWLTYVAWVLTSVVVVYSGSSFYTGAFAQARQRSVSMDLLVVLGVSAAWGVSTLQLFWPSAFPTNLHLHAESAAVIVFFILLGRYLEEVAKTRAVANTESLFSLDSQVVEVVRESVRVSVPASEVRVGEHVHIPAGARIPVDGFIVEGKSYINESMLTGEPMPVAKQQNDSVTSGTHNTGSALVIQATQTGPHTTFARFVAEIQRAQRTKSPTQRLVDKWVQYYVPGVGALALFTFLAWGFFGGAEGFSIGLITSLTVLLISCPCALGLATPVVVRLGISQAAKMGLLVTQASSFETAAQIDTVFLDKTGTLTEGQPEVEALFIDPAAVGRSGTYLPAFLTMVGQSLHPLSKALQRYLRAKHLKPVYLPSIQEQPGKGLSATLNENILRVGSLSWLQAEGCQVSDAIASHLTDFAEKALSVVAAAYGERVVLLAAISDPIKPDAYSAIANMTSEGMNPVMLTGDHIQVAGKLAQKLGIKEVKAGLLPEDKSQIVIQAKAAGKKVAFVGDGMNDAVALAEADLAIAMGSGTDMAKHASGIVALGGKLESLADFLRLSRFGTRLIRQNLVWAFGYNLLALPLATGLFYPYLMLPTVAGLAMAISSLAVVINSARMAGWQPSYYRRNFSEEAPKIA